jgi:polysaccharide deacetylase 2 family uncharacterized protein YibQ
MRRRLSLIVPLLAAVAFGLLIVVFIARRAWREETPPAVSLPSPPPTAEGRAAAQPGRPQPEVRAPAPARKTPARPKPRTPGEPARAAIIMDDLGNSLEPLRALCALGRRITASVLPFAAETLPSVKAAHDCGLEVMLHLPLESLVKPPRTPEGTISSGMSRDEVRARVLACLEQVPGCRGVNNHAGSKATEDAVLMPAILEVLRDKELYFVDSRTTSATVAYETARGLGLPAAERNVFLDGVLDDEAIKGRIEELFRIARDTGRAVGICHPKAETLAALRKHLGLAEAYGVTLVFASEIVE